ncbi:hypothetical protein CERZMDRAFT_88268 [Cercospora zeae-maydis SCOH1-5]|uniref:Uncharacterized protein n=1 Tax=Cercospora zeae-maydis SCOH1-5 TaxID=717836 RepID=A0A6A6F024_9PEZI|nr:hypothetical protein CERZMDRAFT_88268 [Cercospora zeae-maydis SCOH1-5]
MCVRRRPPAETKLEPKACMKAFLLDRTTWRDGKGRPAVYKTASAANQKGVLTSLPSLKHPFAYLSLVTLEHTHLPRSEDAFHTSALQDCCVSNRTRCESDQTCGTGEAAVIHRRPSQGKRPWQARRGAGGREIHAVLTQWS